MRWHQPSACNISVDGCIFRRSDIQKRSQAFVENGFLEYDFLFWAASSGNVVVNAASHRARSCPDAPQLISKKP
jgi:hypothetical protein